ncbi:MAG: hypothetical protein J2P21_17425 [Chloracidobacterium sp.]|nr:hypothetical protein [Chloracidobacterium sp.]
MNSLPVVYRSMTLAMLVLGTLLLLVNVLLARQNQKLKILAGRPDRALEVRPGTKLPPLEGFDVDGNRHTIAYSRDSRKTILLVISPRCRACEQSLPNLKAIVNGLDQKSFRLAAVSLQSEGLKEYMYRRGLDRVPVLTEVDPKLRVAYNLSLTPQIILIDAGGAVEKVWTGLLRGEDKHGVESTLNVRLP